jgi:hypothetical protein
MVSEYQKGAAAAAFARFLTAVLAELKRFETISDADIALIILNENLHPVILHHIESVGR